MLLSNRIENRIAILIGLKVEFQIRKKWYSVVSVLWSITFLGL